MDQALKCPCCNKRVFFKDLQTHQKERCPETATGLHFRALGFLELPSFGQRGLADEEIFAVLRKVVASDGLGFRVSYIPIRTFS